MKLFIKQAQIHLLKLYIAIGNQIKPIESNRIEFNQNQNVIPPDKLYLFIYNTNIN